MFSEELHPFSHTLQTSHEWMKTLMQELGVDDPQQAYRALRGALRALREQLKPDEAADLGAQLPMLLRGLYYDGFKPSREPEKRRHLQEFLDRINEDLRTPGDPDAQTAFTSVFITIERNITLGESTDVRSMLPSEIRQTLPEPQPAK